MPVFVNDPIFILATVIFGVAILHTFSVKLFHHLALKQTPLPRSWPTFFSFLGEVEVVFGFWAGVLMLILFFARGGDEVVRYLEGLNFTEPCFVFVIMTMTATVPVLRLAIYCLESLSKIIPLPGEVAFCLVALTVGPLLGSLITEPAAMTVTALVLNERFFKRDLPRHFRYALLGVLFVNVSIGGVLTHFATPPVLMVAPKWGWTTPFMFAHFGWRAMLAIGVNTALLVGIYWKSLVQLKPLSVARGAGKIPPWLYVLHVIGVTAVVMNSHHTVIFFGCFLFFLGVTGITKGYQEELKLRESLLVGFFLAGLVVLGGMQGWWLEPLMRRLGPSEIYFGTTALTAFMDNAAVTYLGAQVPGISEAFKYALVAGSVTGGGLTVIANAPNPAGFAILQKSFGPEGISPLGLLISASIPTIVAVICFWFLPG